MANYLYLFRGGGMKHMSPQQLEESMGKWAAWVGELSRQGRFKGGEPVADDGRVLTSRKTVTDGPFGETKDLVGGYLLVTAPDLETATELARGCPILNREDGSVEVRELREMKF